MENFYGLLGGYVYNSGANRDIGCVMLDSGYSILDTRYARIGRSLKLCDVMGTSVVRTR